jgi:hypothetical protein
MTIKILKLVSGEELVADITLNASIYKLVKPFALQMARDPNSDSGQMQLALFPYAPYTKDHTVHINREKVVWSEELPESMIMDYETALINLSVSRQNAPDDSDITDV